MNEIIIVWAICIIALLALVIYSTRKPKSSYDYIEKNDRIFTDFYSLGKGK